ncbi:MAG: helix-turn-helix domain-containing protein [Candidatus Methanospirareceae archaeon]
MGRTASGFAFSSRNSDGAASTYPPHSKILQDHRAGGPEATEAEIITLACTSPPDGRVRWTIRLLAEKLNEREGFETINRETVRLVLKKAKLDLG